MNVQARVFIFDLEVKFISGVNPFFRFKPVFSSEKNTVFPPPVGGFFIKSKDFFDHPVAKPD